MILGKDIVSMAKVKPYELKWDLNIGCFHIAFLIHATCHMPSPFSSNYTCRCGHLTGCLCHHYVFSSSRECFFWASAQRGTYSLVTIFHCPQSSVTFHVHCCQFLVAPCDYLPPGPQRPPTALGTHNSLH